MSVLESLYIVLGIEASGVKKGLDEAKKAGDSFGDSFQKVQEKLSNGFEGLIKKIGGLALAYISVNSIISGIKNSLNLADTLGELSESIGVDIEQLSAWGHAVKISGGTAESFQGAIRSMAAELTEFATKGKSRVAPFFDQLGIKMVDSRGKARQFIDLLPEIAAAFEKISKSESLGIGQKLGLDEGTIMLLQKGRREVDDIIKRQKELGVVTKEDAEIAAKFNDAWDDTAHIFQTLFMKINSYLLPPLTKVVQTFEKLGKLFTKYETLFVSLITAVAGAIIILLIPAIISLATAAAPFLLIGTAISGLLLLLAIVADDIWQFAKGNNSVLGELVKKWPLLGEVIKGVVAAFKFLFAIAKSVLQFLVDLFKDPENAWKNYEKSVREGIEKLLNAFPFLRKVLETISPIFNKIRDTAESAFIYIADLIEKVFGRVSKNIDRVISLYQKAKGIITTVKNNLDNTPQHDRRLFKSASDAIKLSNAFPLNSQNSNSILANRNATSNKNTSVNISEINIQTQASAPGDIASSISQNLDSQLRQTINNFDDGVMI